ncbi:unnamed protein product [Acanthoscelides obtectus]|uniref:Cap-specific mRNA (nucleoside-2'-O-)-methyltransferase 1 n=1 Tax=Acanthoscelides obtectus TaxID=200917 RepID=A0A9P0KV51_ACAOB|nr:unnamed protein product [Acanthoscelides obtectus]CAK1657733.1 Cap-specific mRNA (nucleoside-2'-O-)-methyltransferase 1 [Acanthoscelides obtectus]
MFSKFMVGSEDGVAETTKNESQEKNAKTVQNNAAKTSFIDDKILRMMGNMGYKSGTGLGKNEQGITSTIDITYQLGKRGLGLDIKNLNSTQELWDFSKENVNVKEELIWIENKNDDSFYDISSMSQWIKEGAPKYQIEDETNFCDKDILHNVIQSKNIFDELDLLELCKARSKANPFETIRSVYFMNRAALKMANIDAATNFMFSRIDENEHHKSHPGPFYFADICAGPGGFTEYILWRRQWFFKGFGLTLKEENNFRLHESTCASPVSFQAIYGKDDDGNVCSPDNIEDFRDRIKHETGGKGVHFLMADGGFSVDGNENLQEILSKNIYICQCVVALQVICNNGHFVTKLFDVFTCFSVGLLYLIYRCFEKVSIFKPNSSRPANAERYFICYGLKANPVVDSIKEYLWKVVKRLWEISECSDVDVLEIVPLEIIQSDRAFCDYIRQSNNRLGERQIVGLQKLAAFCRNPTLVDTRQEELRKECLEYWQIPDKPRCALPSLSIDDVLNAIIDRPEILLVQPRELDSIDNFTHTVQDVEDWHYCSLYSSQVTNHCNFYVGITSSKVYRLQRNKWVKVKNLALGRGTVLYGEFVKETVKLKNRNAEEKCSFRYSLHVIDALQLADKSLTDLSFNERMKIIKIYCKAINKESYLTSVRVRPKVLEPMANLAFNSSLKKRKNNHQYFQPLPVMGAHSHEELYDIHSLLLLKTNSSQSFHSTYVLRVQMFLKAEGCPEDKKYFALDEIVSNLKERV